MPTPLIIVVVPKALKIAGGIIIAANAYKLAKDPELRQEIKNDVTKVAKCAKQTALKGKLIYEKAKLNKQIANLHNKESRSTAESQLLIQLEARLRKVKEELARLKEE
jgi:hypothetical protein